MSATIDQKVVEMQFNNGQFESGVKTSVSTLDKLKSSLNFKDAGKSFDGLTAAAKGVNLSSISDGVRNISDHFGIMGAIGFTVIQNLTEAALGLVVSLGKVLLGVDSIQGGFQEYEAGLTAFQTIIANTKSAGTTAEQVTAALAELNIYANKTIYSYGDMTKAAGLFTAQGVNLKDSLTGIKGIFNIVSLTGGNADKANSAIYQLSQAIASGTVKAQDWISVVNAGIGGTDFQHQLKQTAKVHGVNVDAMIAKEGSFKASLQDGWLTSEILLETLSQYTGDLGEEQLKSMGYSAEQIKQIQELGTRANDSATKLKSFTQLIDMLKSNLVTSWSASFKILFGNLDEAITFWTDIGNTIGGVLQGSSDARNALLQGWKDLGGRSEIIAGIKNIMDSLLSVMNTVAEAFKSIFPPVTSKQLYDLSVGFERLTYYLKMGSPMLDKIKRIFVGLFSILDIGRMFVVALAKGLWSLISPLGSSAEGFTEFIAKIGDWFKKLRDTIKGTDAFGKAIGSVIVFIRPAITFLQTLSDKVKNFLSTMKLTDALKGGTSFGEKIKSMFAPLGKVGELLAKFGAVLAAVWKIISPILSKFGSAVASGFGTFLDAVLRGLNNFDPNKTFATINGGLLAAILLGVRSFISKGKSVFSGVSDILDGVKGSLEAWQQSLKSQILLKIAEAIALLAAALFVISLIDGKKLSSSLIAISVMLLELFTALDRMTNTKGTASLAVLAGALIAISAALLILAGAVTILGHMDTASLVKGVGAIAALMAIMKFVGDTMSKSLLGVAEASTGMVIFAAAMLLMSLAIRALGSIQTDTLVKGLLAMAGSLVVIGTAMRIMPSNMASTGVQLALVAGSLLLLALGLKTLGSMSWDQITAGLVALAGSMGILVIGLNAMTGTIAGSAALLIAAAALALLAPALAMLGAMPIEAIGVGLLALVGVFVVLGLAGAILTPVIPTLLALGAAMLIIGLAALAVGVGVAAFAAGLAVLGTVAAAGAGAITLILSGIANALPIIGKKLAEALMSFIGTIITGSPMLLTAAVTFFKMLIQAIDKVAPDLIAAGIKMIILFCAGLITIVPVLVKTGYSILLAFMSGLRDNIGKVTTLAYDILLEYMRAVRVKFPQLIQAGYDMLIAFIDGIADAAEKNIPRVMESVNKLGQAIIDGIIAGVENGQGGLFSIIWDLGKSLLGTLQNALDSHSPSREFAKIGAFAMQGLAQGITKTANLVRTATGDVGKNAVSQLKTVASQISEALNANMDANPTIRPVLDLTDLQNGSSTISKMFANKAFNVATTANMVPSVTPSGGASSPEPNTPANGVAPANVSFTQNNYSPKELSRIDIYRQTNNQLARLKRLKGV